MWSNFFIRERKAILIIIILVITYLIIIVICANLYKNLQNCQLSQPIKLSSAVPYCDDPSMNCKEYIKDMEEWIKYSGKQESQYLQCNLDLSRCQNKLNMDIICIEPNCI